MASIFGGLKETLFGGGQPDVTTLGTLNAEQKRIIEMIAGAGSAAGPGGGIGGLAETFAGLSGAPRTAFEEEDPAILENALRGIDLQTEEGLGNLLSSGERFSSGNLLNRRRLAQRGQLAKRGQLLDFRNRGRLMKMQDLQNAFANQQNAAGMFSNFLTAPLGVKAQENIVSPGGGGLAPLIGAGIGFGLAGPGGGLAGAGTGALFGNLFSNSFGG